MSEYCTLSPLDELRAAVNGRAPREAGRAAVYRLLAGGAAGDRRAPPAAEYDEALDAALEALPAALDERDAVRAEAARLAAQLADIGRMSPAEARSRAARADAALRADMVRELVRLGDAAALDEPAHGLVLAGVAVAAAEAARPAPDDLEGQDLRAEARRALAEAAYRGGDLIAAEGALGEAARLARLGTHDVILRSDLLRLESEIRCDQGRHAEARQLSERALALVLRRHDRRREARARVSLAYKLHFEGRLADALAESERALAVIDPELDGRLLLAARFNRAYWLVDAGDTAPALAEMPGLAELIAAHGRVLDRVRLDWLAARIAAADGELERAAELYRPVLDRCLELDILFDSALVALELAVVQIELGRAAEVLSLAEMVAPLFRAQGVETEAAAAVLLAAESLRQGVAAHEVLSRLTAIRGAARRGR